MAAWRYWLLSSAWLTFRSSGDILKLLQRNCNLSHCAGPGYKVDTGWGEGRGRGRESDRRRETVKLPPSWAVKRTFTQKGFEFFFFFALSLPSSHLSCRNMQHLSIQQQQPNIPTAIYIIDVGEWMAQCGTKNSNMPARSYVVIRQLSEYQMAYLDQLDCFN